MNKKFLAIVSSLFLANSVTTTLTASAQEAKDWKEVYPLEYYSVLAGMNDIDDLHDKNFGYSHGNMAINMQKSIANSKTKGLNATCFSCKTATFNAIYKKYGDKVFLGQPSPEYTGMLKPIDFWSCETCHEDMKNPKASVGAQIMSPKLFGKELFDKLPAKVAVCAQCHNNLAPWSDSRIITGMTALKENKTPYRYGWDPDSMIKATFEDALPTGVRFPTAKIYSSSPASHTKTDKELGIYLIANGNHADAELYMGGIHQKLNVGCADCHMPMLQDRMGNPYRSHNSSKSVLNSRASMEYCLTCHKNDEVKNVGDMVKFVKDAQGRLAERDKAVAEKLDETFPLLKTAIEAKKLSPEILDQARLNYAMAAYYKEYVYGNRGATPGKKVAHNPTYAQKYLDKACKLLEETQQMLKTN